MSIGGGREPQYKDFISNDCFTVIVVHMTNKELELDQLGILSTTGVSLSWAHDTGKATVCSSVQHVKLTSKLPLLAKIYGCIGVMCRTIPWLTQ